LPNSCKRNIINQRMEGVAMKTDKRCSCFSLVEMLVVMGVLAVLFALVIPGITSAREKGRAVRCQNNLKELHAAAINYAGRGADNYLGQKDLPRSRSSEWFVEETEEWRNVVGWVDWVGHPKHSVGDRGYAKWWGPDAYKSITSTDKGWWDTTTLWEFTGQSLKIYSCPTFVRSDVAGATSPDNKNLTFNYDVTSAGAVLRSYGMNMAVSAQNPGSGADSRKILFADMSAVVTTNGVTIASRCLLTKPGTFNTDFANCWHVDGEFQTNVISANYCRESVGTYHGGKANAIFVDGHIETIDPRDTYKAFSGKW